MIASLEEVADVQRSGESDSVEECTILFVEAYVRATRMFIDVSQVCLDLVHNLNTIIIEETGAIADQSMTVEKK